LLGSYFHLLQTALFAGALVSLAQLVATNDTSSPAWDALRFFTYAAIAINLSGTTLALIIIKMCTDVAFTAQRLLISDPRSWPARLARGESLPREILGDQVQFPVAFGMSRGYIWLDWGAAVWFLLGFLSTFASLTLWIWLTQSFLVAATLLLVIAPSVFGVISVIFLTNIT